MWNMLWPILLVVGGNTIYNICTKSTPESVNGFASLTISYVVAGICALVMFFLTSEEKNLAAELAKTNWTAWVLGAVLVVLEFGFIAMYRAGWRISIAVQYTNIALACVLVLVGMLLYKETLTPRQVIGMAVSALGLLLMTK